MWHNEEDQKPPDEIREHNKIINTQCVEKGIKNARQMPPGMSITLDVNCVVIKFQPPMSWPCGNYATPISLFEDPIEFKKLMNIGYKQYCEMAWQKRAICERRGFKDKYTVT